MNTNGSPRPIVPRTDDIAFQPPSDPTRDLGALRSRARIIHREIPNVATQTGWSVSDVRQALVDLASGIFDRPAQLQDAIASDSRVQSAMRSRSGGLLGRPVRFAVPTRFKNDKTARRCLTAWERHWPQMAAEPALLDLIETASSLGFSYAQTLWDTSGTIWKPYLLPFNPRYTYYLWTARQHIAITLDGQVPITAGDGHWVMHAPYGQYRGWMRGALRSLAQWWLARNYALRDWARYCERHGFPILLADTPFGADPNDVAAYTSQLAGIGQESVLQLPGGPDLQKYGKYDLRYLEPKDENWQAFKALIDQCNDEITLALLGQNLTTQVKEGSFAAARVHADVRQSILEAEARSLAKTIYLQVARPFAALNFGNADYAPTIKWDVSPVEDAGTMAQALSVFSQAVRTLREAGELIDVKRLAKLCNLPYAALKSAHVNEAPIYAYHMTAGVVTANEVRSRLGLPPVDGGDDLLPTAATAATKAADAKAEEVDDEDDKAEAKPSRKETSGAKTLSLAAPGRRSARDRAARA